MSIRRWERVSFIDGRSDVIVVSMQVGGGSIGSEEEGGVKNVVVE